MTGERVPCPEGFEPVVDTVCGEPAMYVEITRDSTKMLSDIKKMWPDGTRLSGAEYARCWSCNRTPSGWKYNQMGLRRDEQGVRRLW